LYGAPTAFLKYGGTLILFIFTLHYITLHYITFRVHNPTHHLIHLVHCLISSLTVFLTQVSVP